jgi:hypothetical protein
MPLKEMKMMPHGFLKKYGSYLNHMTSLNYESRLEENRAFRGYYEQIKLVNKVLTDQDKEKELEHKEFLEAPEVIEQENFIREEGDYMRRQPRVDLKKHGNYNFEQFRRFTEVYEDAREKDDRKSREFYRLTKYVKENIENKNDVLVNMMTEMQSLRPELIEVPPEFESLSTDDMSELYTKDKDTGGRGRRKIKRNRTDKSLF